MGWVSAGLLLGCSAVKLGCGYAGLPLDWAAVKLDFG